MVVGANNLRLGREEDDDDEVDGGEDVLKLGFTNCPVEEQNAAIRESGGGDKRRRGK